MPIDLAVLTFDRVVGAERAFANVRERAVDAPGCRRWRSSSAGIAGGS